MKNIARLKIYHKLLFGSAVYLAVAVSFGVYVYMNIGEVVVKQRLVEVADDARDEVLELRRNEKNYIIRKDVEYINKIHAVAGKLQDQVANLGPDIVAAFGADDYDALKGSLDEYSTLIVRFSENYKTEDELAVRLRTAGRALEEAVLKYGDSRLTRQVLELRILEKNYVLYKDRRYIGGLKDGVEKLRGSLTNGAARALCEDYLSLADRLVASDRAEAVLLTEVQDSAKRMQSIIEKVARRERNDIDAYIAKSQRLLLGSLLALLTLGPLVIWFMARAIASPLQQLEETARRISEGDDELRVKVHGDYETASLQRSFNVMVNRLQDTQESLEDTIRLLHEKNAQLVESEKLASIGILASGVAHEINNPLANISLTAETIAESGPGIKAEELAGFTKDIIEQTERAQAVVTNLLGYTRSMKDREWSEVDLADALGRAVRLVSHQVKLHDVKLSEDLPGSGLPVTGNSGKLEQVFVNIMLNALQAMGQGGELKLRACRDDAHGQAVVEIKDTGPGISPDGIHHVFDPFYTTKPLGEGTGLGLYISYGIVREHGGEIEVESVEGEGATFKIRLPISSQSPAGSS